MKLNEATRERKNEVDYGAMSNADFKERIRRLMGDTATVQGASRSHPCVVRGPQDRGYYPPPRKWEPSEWKGKTEAEKDTAFFVMLKENSDAV